MLKSTTKTLGKSVKYVQGELFKDNCPRGNFLGGGSSCLGGMSGHPIYSNMNFIYFELIVKLH